VRRRGGADDASAPTVVRLSLSTRMAMKARAPDAGGLVSLGLALHLRFRTDHIGSYLCGGRRAEGVFIPFFFMAID
jgi:hypothetical protein